VSYTGVFSKTKRGRTYGPYDAGAKDILNSTLVEKISTNFVHLTKTSVYVEKITPHWGLFGKITSFIATNNKQLRHINVDDSSTPPVPELWLNPMARNLFEFQVLT
jgi:hypothetical protein